jgi:predicted nucleotidyltransferase
VHHAPVLSPRSFPGRDDGTDLQDPRRRAAVATVLCAALAASVPDSVASVRGSLATGNADPFSDIDLRWVVHDPAFAIAIERAWSTAETIGPLALGRLDPDLARSDRRRVLFLQYAHLPLFWRVDLEVRAASVAEADGYDDDNPAARAEHWSRPASALMNAVAALRAERRGRPVEADGLLARGFARIERQPAKTRTIEQRASELAAACAAQERGLAPLAARLDEIVGTVGAPEDSQPQLPKQTRRGDERVDFGKRAGGPQAA